MFEYYKYCSLEISGFLSGNMSYNNQLDFKIDNNQVDFNSVNNKENFNNNSNDIIEGFNNNIDNFFML